MACHGHYRHMKNHDKQGYFLLISFSFSISPFTTFTLLFVLSMTIMASTGQADEGLQLMEVTLANQAHSSWLTH